ncbi:MAG: hypothetical protein JXO22_06165 [Phycisphaerae bacterium]|nr:hypothetical protein [Phycisphaerae bacterium]
MAKSKQQAIGPGGGLQAHARARRAWYWSRAGDLISAPVRCKREEWYVARASLREPDRQDTARIIVRFLAGDAVVGQRCLTLYAPANDAAAHDLLGWLQAPQDATHLQLQLVRPEDATLFTQLVLHPAAERDPKCHPLAAVPRWSTYKPPFPLGRVLLPRSLASLANTLSGLDVEILPQPRSARELRRKIARAACVLPANWVTALSLSLADLEWLAAESCVIVDLETMVRVADKAGAAATKVVTHKADHDIMSARVEYADVATRGFAMQDVFPYGAITEAAGFRMRVLVANRSWKRYADENGFASLLASETPFVEHCGDVLLASLPTGGGELMATDLPWLAAEEQGRLLAPRLTQHVLRMCMGAALPDTVEYWNRWNDDGVLLRDIGDLPRRFAGLEAVRWASDDPTLAHLGVSLRPSSGAAERHVLIQTGRSDQCGAHDGLPPEPMVIFMKMLARDAADGTAWGRRHLAQTRVTWQFDTAAGLRNIVTFLSAAPIMSGPAVETMRLIASPDARAKTAGDSGTATARTIRFSDSPGLHGDGSLEYQDRLTRRLRKLVEQGGKARA